MKINHSRFCEIATSSLWQSWLYSFDVELYNKFVTQLRVVTGCSGYHDVMLRTLDEIQKKNGDDKLLLFLKTHYPQALIGYKSQMDFKQDEVFGYYNPGIITYPRRHIIQGANLKQEVMAFVKDKLKHEHIIIKNKAYVEYLLPQDEPIIDQIKDDKWLIKAWKRRKSKL